MYKITVDASGFQSADNGSTTTYGGVVKVGDQEIEISGTDRDMVNCYDDILAVVTSELNISVPPEEWQTDREIFYDEFMRRIDDHETFDVCRQIGSNVLTIDPAVKIPVVEAGTEIEICQRLQDNWTDDEGRKHPMWHAQKKDAKGVWGTGRHPADAIGAMVYANPEAFGLTITTLEGRQPR